MPGICKTFRTFFNTKIYEQFINFSDFENCTQKDISIKQTLFCLYFQAKQFSKTIIGKKGPEATINALNSKNWLNYEHLLFLKNIDIEIVLDTFHVNNFFYHKNCFPKVIITRPRSSNLLEQNDCLTDGIVLHAIGFITKNANTSNCIFLHDLMHELVITSMSELVLCNNLKSLPLMDDYIVSYDAPHLFCITKSCEIWYSEATNQILRKFGQTCIIIIKDYLMETLAPVLHLHHL